MQKSLLTKTHQPLNRMISGEHVSYCGNIKMSAYAASASNRSSIPLSSPTLAHPFTTKYLFPLPKPTATFYLAHSHFNSTGFEIITSWFLSIFQVDFASNFSFVWNYTKLLQFAAAFSLFLSAKRHLGIKTNCPALDSRSPTFCVRHKVKLFQCGADFQDFILKGTI